MVIVIVFRQRFDRTFPDYFLKPRYIQVGHLLYNVLLCNYIKISLQKSHFAINLVHHQLPYIVALSPFVHVRYNKEKELENVK